MTHCSDYFTDLMQCSFARSKKRKNKNTRLFWHWGGLTGKAHVQGPYVLVLLEQKQVLTICATLKRALGIMTYLHCPLGWLAGPDQF